MQEIRKHEGLTPEELEEHTVELLPDREEMQTFVNINVGAAALAVQGAQAGFGQANQGFFLP